MQRLYFVRPVAQRLTSTTGFGRISGKGLAHKPSHRSLSTTSVDPANPSSIGTSPGSNVPPSGGERRGKRPEVVPWREQDPDGPVLGPLRSQKFFFEKGQSITWCQCGLSKNQPFCDGSHVTTKFKPITFVAPESRIYGLCLCKYSEDGALCDGIHKQFKGWVKKPRGSAPQSAPTVPADQLKPSQ